MPSLVLVWRTPSARTHRPPAPAAAAAHGPHDQAGRPASDPTGLPRAAAARPAGPHWAATLNCASCASADTLAWRKLHRSLRGFTRLRHTAGSACHNRATRIRRGDPWPQTCLQAPMPIGRLRIAEQPAPSTDPLSAEGDVD